MGDPYEALRGTDRHGPATKELDSTTLVSLDTAMCTWIDAKEALRAGDGTLSKVLQAYAAYLKQRRKIDPNWT